MVAFVNLQAFIREPAGDSRRGCAVPLVPVSCDMEESGWSYGVQKVERSSLGDPVDREPSHSLGFKWEKRHKRLDYKPQNGCSWLCFCILYTQPLNVSASIRVPPDDIPVQAAYLGSYSKSTGRRVD